MTLAAIEALGRIQSEVGRAHDARLTGAIIAGVATVCPFPVVVWVDLDYDTLKVRAPGVTLATVGRNELHNRSELAGIMLIIRRAVAGYLDLDPLPHDHPLGQE